MPPKRFGSLKYSEPGHQPRTSYKAAAGFSNGKLEVIRAELSDGAREAMPGRMMQRKLGLPVALPQQAW
jgi:hypothetical protein